MEKLVQNKCEKMYIEYIKYKFSIINYNDMLICDDSSILEPIMIIIQYLQLNYRFILAETIFYIRTLILVYIREDSMTFPGRVRTTWRYVVAVWNLFVVLIFWIGREQNSS